MPRITFLLSALILFSATVTAQPPDNTQLAEFFKKSSEEFYKLNPLAATFVGEMQYNDQMPVTFTDSYNMIMKDYFNRNRTKLLTFDRNKLNDNDKISYDIFLRNMDMSLEGLTYKSNRIPFTQFGGLQLSLGQLGSGTGAQPFKTVQDYKNWISRAQKFAGWADSAIVYFKKGIAEGIVLPRALVVKMIPQLDALSVEDITKSVFWGPVNKFPEDFPDADKERYKQAFTVMIRDYINPSYKRLSAFLSSEYLPNARETSGIGALPDGKRLYDFAIRSFTTTTKTPDELFNIGLSEVKRIREEMEKVRNEVKFEGNLDSFFVYTKTNPKFLPYKTSEEVLIDYRAIQTKINPNLDKFCTLRPKTSFEVRQTEAFRAASAAAQYFSGLADGSRPGIFYVPIVDATKYTVAKENLFIHEAIPGHHFQIMIQKENKRLPRFRQEGGFSAYSEGWGLYCESQGKLVGCYSDPYQYFYALGDEMHRAIRLVVDAGIHSKGWTREEAIKYMRANEPITEQSATAEIERYMANPGQALSYKVGELKIKELRAKYEKKLGAKFKLTEFHDELLRDGAMPLSVLEIKMDKWAAGK